MDVAGLKGLAKFAARRAVLCVGVLFGVMVISFFLCRVVVPNPAHAWAGPHASPDMVEALTVRFHLRDPIYIQFYYYLSDFLHGDWGVSPLSGVPVLYSIEHYMPATVELTIAALLLILIIGIPLGVVAAVNRNKWPDHFGRLISLSGVASPPFLAALIMQLVFFYYLRVFPDSGGRISLFVNQPPHITGLLTVDSLLAANLPAFESAIVHLVMPSFTLAFLNLGLMSRLVRASLLEALASDYVRTAKAKGLKRRLVVYKHALRNALIQPITALSVYVAYLLGGSVVTELIFSWPGVGRYGAQAALNFDLPGVMGTVLIFATVVVLANLVTDIVYAALDPRIRLG